MQRRWNAAITWPGNVFLFTLIYPLLRNRQTSDKQSPQGFAALSAAVIAAYDVIASAAVIAAADVIASAAVIVSTAFIAAAAVIAADVISAPAAVIAAATEIILYTS